MYKSGLIFGAAALLLGAVASGVLSPWCGPCVGLFLGLGAGYLAGVFEKPSSNNSTVRAGAIAGAVGGGGAIIGQVIGGVLNSFFANSEAVRSVYQSWGLPTNDPSFATGMQIGVYLWPICCSIVDVIVMAGFGALGGLLWWQITGKNAAPPAPTVVS